MAVPAHTITCLRKERIAPGVYEFAFTKPEGFSFKAGQFILFDVPLPENTADVQPRAYSIASSPAEEDLLFCVKMKPGGRASVWMEQMLEQGSQAVMKGPFGLFTIDRATPKSYLFIATGTGIAPFRSQIKWLLEEEKEMRRIDLVFGVRNSEDLFWIDQFADLEKEHENFRFHRSLTSGEPDWHGHRGRVQHIIPEVVSDFSSVQAYLCGAPDMVKDVKTLCLTEWGMEKKDVKGESYI